MDLTEKQKVIIIGGGPAGLTAAYELLKSSDKYDVTVFEESAQLGGISKTVAYRGNRMDMGGHRFFSKSKIVNDWWQNMLPLQGSPAKDDKLLNRKFQYPSEGPNPDEEDEVMLMRRRVSRIYFNGKFYDYPISMKLDTFKNMGFVNTVKCGCSYLYAALHKLPEDNLENFYINSFGRQLYSMFFEYYTENLWGRHPSEIDASWGAQRTKGLSIGGVIKDAAGKLFHIQNREVNTSLIEEFKYPKLGPGQLWEVTGDRIRALGGKIVLNAEVKELYKNGSRIESIKFIQNGIENQIAADIVISSMPLKDLIEGMNDVPFEQRRIASGLPYRDYMTLGVLVDKFELKNTTNISTVGNIIPDCWIYVQDRNVKMGRFQIFNNWSPYLVKDLEHTVWIGLEYFCNEGDNFWLQTESEFSEFGINEMIKLGLIKEKSAVLDTHMEKVKKAYPAYFDTYSEIDSLISWLNSIENLYCVGRNGQHRYNNLDHSMLTSIEAVKCIVSENKDRSAVWNVNTEKEYHEHNR